jgi:hypothetical protein
VNAPLSEQQLAEIAARATAATKGPWTPRFEYPFLVLQAADGTPTDDIPGLFSTSLAASPKEDTAFIAAAREDVPALLAEVEWRGKQQSVLEDELTELREEYANTVARVAEVDRLRDFKRRITEEIEEFEDAANDDPATPPVALHMIKLLRMAMAEAGDPR